MQEYLYMCEKNTTFAANLVIMATNNKETLDLAALGRFLKRNWYWFVISLFVCSAAAVAYYLTAPRTYQIAMAIQLRAEEDAVWNPGTGLMQTTTQELEAGDEKAVVISWDVIRRAIGKDELNVLYFKKRPLRWEEKSVSQSDLQAIWCKGALDSLIHAYKITVSVEEDAVLIQTKCGRKKAQYTIASLAEPWTSPEGITVEARKELKPGDKYRVIVTSLGLATARYDGDFKTEYPKRSKHILDLYATTKYPNNTMAIMRNQIAEYNRVTLEGRKDLAKQAVAALDSRIAETTNSELKLLLMQRREEKIMAAESTVQPAVIISNPHVYSESVAPSLESLAIMALLLGIGLPLLVLYVLFVIRTQKK